MNTSNYNTEFSQGNNDHFSNLNCGGGRPVTYAQDDRQSNPPPQSILSILPKLPWEAFVEAFGDNIDASSKCGKSLRNNTKTFSGVFYVINYCIRQHNDSISRYGKSEFSVKRSDLNKKGNVLVKESGFTINLKTNAMVDKIMQNLRIDFLSEVKKKDFTIKTKGTPTLYQINESMAGIFKQESISKAKQIAKEDSKFNRIKSLGINPDQKFTCYCCKEEKNITAGCIDKNLPIVHRLCECGFKKVHKFKVLQDEYWIKFRNGIDLGTFAPFEAEIDKPISVIEPVDASDEISSLLDKFHKLTNEEQIESLRIVIDTYEPKLKN